MTSRHERLPKPEREITPYIPHSKGLERALGLAREEAEKQRDRYLRTGHLLLGLSREETSRGILDSLGLTTEAIRSNIRIITPKGKEPVDAENITLSTSTRMALRLAATEAIQTHAREVTTTLALMGIILEGHGIAIQVIKELSLKNPNDLLPTLRRTSS